MLKDGAILLNLGRGGIINEEDLAKNIASKDILCGLDVLSLEPISKDNPLLKVVKAKITFNSSHSFNSVEVRKDWLRKLFKY